MQSYYKNCKYANIIKEIFETTMSFMHSCTAAQLISKLYIPTRARVKL